MLALSRLAPSSRAPTSVTRSRIAPERFVLERSAPERSAPKKSVLLRLAFLKSRLDKIEPPQVLAVESGVRSRRGLEEKRGDVAGRKFRRLGRYCKSNARERGANPLGLPSASSRVAHQPSSGSLLRAVSDPHERLRGEPRFDLYRRIRSVARALRASRTAQPMKTSPTGLAGLPPPGPAIPVMDKARSAAAVASAPSAIACATSALTAPYRSISGASTPIMPVLAASA